ncbi:hypothetical protein JCM8208_004835 [Rhodotorula glutinis]
MPAAAPATTDSWVTTASTSRQPLVPSPVTTTTTPTKRASRSSRISNDTDHPAFTRTSLDPDTGLESSLEFRVGDTVVVNELAKLKQKFLAPPSYLVPQKKHSRTKAKGKGKAVAQQDEDEDDDNWRHEDGLRAGDKVAVITRLFEDVRGRKMAMVRWFARPGAVWGEQGPDEDHDEFGEVMPYELYFTSDSTYLQESRLLRQKAAANPFSSPSSSSPTKRRGTSSSALPSPSRGSSSSFLSSAASFRTPLHSDAVPLSTIASSAEVFSPSALADTAITAAHQRPVPMFVCTRVYDVKPVAGAGFWGEIEWDEMRRKAVEWYEDRMREGERDVAQDRWDVEPVMEESSSSEEEVDEEAEREKGERRRARNDKAKAAKERKVRERAQNGGASAGESSDDEEDEEDTFANSDDSSSSSDGDSDDSSDSDARSSDDDDDDVLRTPTKPKARTARQLPTPASSSTSSRRASAVTKAKRARPAAPADSGRQAKRRRFAAKARTTKGSTAPTSPTSANALPPLLDARELAKLSPFDRAKALLHVSATPESLPCRDEQRERIRQFLGDAILGRTGGCLYVHGVPGTGKTATVHSVVRELQKDEDMDSFTFVEINGMKISEPMAAFSHLWSALAPSSTSTTASTPRKTSPKAALAALEHHFANPDPARPTTVVLVDELDQMLTKRQDVLYNFFNWPHVAHSRLVVVAVANTMDLPERELSGKIRSRLGTNRIPFQPYTWAELKRILEARLALVALPSSSSSTSTSSPPPAPLFDDVALQKIAKSVAGISGDARKALDVARRTLDRVALRLASSPSSPSSANTAVRCTIQDATAAYNDMTRTGPATFIRRQSTHAKVLLLAVAQCAKRAGVPDVELDTVLAWHGDFVRQAALVDARALYPASRSELVGLVAGLHAQRLVAAESQRLDVFQRVRACVDEGDLFAALREDEVLKAHVPKVL